MSFYCHSQKQEPRNAVNSTFLGSCVLFKLNRSRRFTRQIIHYTVYALHLIYNSCHNLLQYLEWNLGAIRGHEIAGVDCTECNRVVIGTLVAHNADTSHIGQCCEILSKVLGKSCLGDLLAVDVICILHDTYLVGSYFTDDTDTKSWSWEWLTVYQIFRDAKL